MPTSPDVIVVGGGVVGLTIARRLATDGLRVTLLDRAECGREASWAGAGVLSPCNPHRTDPVVDLQHRSIESYPAFCTALREESGIDPEYERCEELELAFNDDALREARSEERVGATRTMPDGRPVYQFLTSDEARVIEPIIAPKTLGALRCRLTGQVRNPRLLQALRIACQCKGVEIREHTAVDDFLVEGDRVTGVRTRGETIAARFTILCAGAWSSTIGIQLKKLMPVHPVRGQMILMRFDKRPFGPIISRGKTYLVPRRDGHVLLGSTEEPKAGFEKRNTPKVVSELMRKAMEMVPMLADAPVQAMWSGLRPGTPDDLPYIGAVPGLDGLIAATGHFRSGLTLAPATAEVVSCLVQGRPYDLDLSCCRPGRF